MVDMGTKLDEIREQVQKEDGLRNLVDKMMRLHDRDEDGYISYMEFTKKLSMRGPIDTPPNTRDEL